MCAQCWATAGTAATAAGGAAGLRAWAAAKRPRRLTAPRLRALTAALILLALCIASLRVG